MVQQEYIVQIKLKSVLQYIISLIQYGTFTSHKILKLGAIIQNKIQGQIIFENNNRKVKWTIY